MMAPRQRVLGARLEVGGRPGAEAISRLGYWRVSKLSLEEESVLP